MKQLLTPAYTFDASAKTVDLSDIEGFDIKKLYAIINIDRNQIIYAIGQPAYGLSSLTGSVLTLVYDTSSHADTDRLGIIYDFSLLEIPGDNIDGSPIPIRALPQHVSRIGFAKAISNGIDTEWGAVVGSIGTGMTVNQTGGNLVITAGTTARSETVIRSAWSWKGGVRLRSRSTLSQRIANNNFFVELVDVIGDALSYTITSATTLVVTIPNNPFTAQNLGQSVSVGLFSGTGTFLSGRYAIASVSGNDVTFTVSGFAAGSGTCSVFGWNFYRLLYDGTTATQAKFDTGRRGYASGDTTATISTTASPGHLAIITGNDVVATFADQLVASSTTIQQTVRATRVENIPDDYALRLQVRVLNGSTAPASGTTWTIGFLSVSHYANQDVSIQDVRPMGVGNGLPVEILRSATIATTLSSTTANIGTSGLTVYTDSSTNLGASATFTGTSRDGGSTPAYNIFTANAFADVAGTLRIEKSTDNTTWRKAAEIAVGANEGKDLTVRCTARYHRVVYVNGAGAQAAFLLTSAYQRI
jgi:hypothetical protein